MPPEHKDTMDQPGLSGARVSSAVCVPGIREKF
jgi:hypothetical protein